MGASPKTTSDGERGWDGVRPAAIRDIAAQAGVSVATVSRVLNDRPDVAPATRATVLRRIQDLGYVSNRNARALAGARTDLIGLTIPFLMGGYFAEIIAGAADALAERGGRLVVCPTRHEHDREVSLLERLMHGTTDGALLILPSETDRELARLHRASYPFVVVDPRGELDAAIPVVAAANWAGGRAATTHLLGLGHTRIGAITGPPWSGAAADRLAGYHSALLAAGLGAEPNFVQAGDFTVESGHIAAHRLFALPAPPSAIFALNDNMAVGALRAARERGLQAPRDLSVVGFDDVEWSAVVEPALTTVRQPLQEMGHAAVTTLYRLIDGQRPGATRLELSTRLVVRASTGPPCPF